MKSMVIFVILLILFSNVVIAKDVDILETFETAEKAVGESETTYFYVGNRLIATKNNENIKYHYQNRLGSDINSKSLPFGQSLKVGERFSFTGKELDEDLYYFNARYYDPNIGRFTSVDPVKDNLPYVYVNNNPMNFIDPTGMDEEDPRLEAIPEEVLLEAQESILNEINNPTSKIEIDPDNAIVVHGESQDLYLFSIVDENFILKDVYDTSTGKSGFGNVIGSGKTPLGLHVIREKIGEGVPLGGIFKARQFTGKIAEISKERWGLRSITTRILRLDGLEEMNDNSWERFIYVHAVSREGTVEKETGPCSEGCVLMRNKEVVEVFDEVKEGTLVYIVR